MKEQRRTLGAIAVIVATALMAFCLAGAPVSATPKTSVSSTHASTTKAELGKAGSLESRVRGEFGREGTVRGTVTPIRWVHQHGKTYLVGNLHAVARRGNGDLVGSTDRRVMLPLKAATASKAGAASCDILNLKLGPLDLNLLGLHVHLKRVHLHIEAIRGAGNLLGNLLCAVTGLLDQGSVLSQLRLTNVLNRILNIVR